jgi:H+/Cl- antiporter ClcA
MRRPFLDQTHLSEQTQMVLLGMGTGVVVGYAAVLFIILIELMEFAFFGEPLRALDILRHVPWYRVLLVPALGGLATGLVIHLFAREAKGHGVSEVMEAVTLQGGVIRGRVGVVKTIASALTLGSGGSVGREGPIVQIGASIASKIGQLLGANPRQLRTLAGCGASAGIGAIFNAPIAGAIFSLEVILGDFELATFAPIVLAAVMGTAVAQSRLGNFPSFEAPVFEVRAVLVEIPFYLLIGALAGLIAALFIKALAFSEDRFERIPLWAPCKPALGGLLVGAMGLVVPWVLGGGYATMTDMLFGRLPWTLLAALVAMKLLATCITVQRLRGLRRSSSVRAGRRRGARRAGPDAGLHGRPGDVRSDRDGRASRGRGAGAPHGAPHGLRGDEQLPDDPARDARVRHQRDHRPALREGVRLHDEARAAGDQPPAGAGAEPAPGPHVGDAMTREGPTVPETVKFGDLLDLLAHSRHIDPSWTPPGGCRDDLVPGHREVAFEGAWRRADRATRELITVTERDDLHGAGRIGSRNIERLPS